VNNIVTVPAEVDVSEVLDLMSISEVLEHIDEIDIVKFLQASYEDEELFEILDLRIEINSYKSIIEELPNLDQEELGMLLVTIIKELK